MQKSAEGTPTALTVSARTHFFEGPQAPYDSHTHAQASVGIQVNYSRLYTQPLRSQRADEHLFPLTSSNW